MTFGYICTWKNERHEVRTDKGRYAAQQEAVAYFQKKFPRAKVKSSDVRAELAELPGGDPYYHSTASVG